MSALPATSSDSLSSSLTVPSWIEVRRNSILRNQHALWYTAAHIRYPHVERELLLLSVRHDCLSQLFGMQTIYQRRHDCATRWNSLEREPVVANRSDVEPRSRDTTPVRSTFWSLYSRRVTFSIRRVCIVSEVLHDCLAIIPAYTETQNIERMSMDR